MPWRAWFGRRCLGWSQAKGAGPELWAGSRVAGSSGPGGTGSCGLGDGGWEQLASLSGETKRSPRSRGIEIGGSSETLEVTQEVKGKAENKAWRFT